MDVWKVGNTFSHSNRWGIPDLLPQSDLYLPDDILPYPWTERGQLIKSPALLHFYVDDYNFEGIWFRTDKSFRKLKRKEIVAIIEPDFSVFYDAPFAINLSQFYRMRYIGRLMQEKGLPVIPNIIPEMPKLTCCGVPKGQVISVRCPSGVVTETEFDVFETGFYHCLEKLKPQKIILWGAVSEQLITDKIPCPFVRLPIGFYSQRDYRKKTRQLSFFNNKS